jgi:hypothetical protein
MSSRRKHRVKFEFLGGLGNQLFQWVAAIHYRNESQANVIVDLTYCGPRFSKHNSLIDQLEFDPTLSLELAKVRNSKATYLFEWFGSHNRYFNFIRNFLQKRIIFRTNGYVEILSDVKPKIVRGYFQTYKYLQSLSSQPIQVSLKAPTAIIPQIADPFAIAIHLRRGDYLNLRDSFGVLADDYYLLALERMHKIVEPSLIYIFGNDVDAAYTLARKIGPKAIVFDTERLESDASTLIALSKFKFLITANSSFSWWAANLNEKKTVIYPSPWFRTIETPEDLHPIDWIPFPAAWLD